MKGYKLTEINWGPSGKLVYDRTYSRTKPNGEKETWDETVERVVDGNLALGDKRHELDDERDLLINLMRDFKILPAGRHLWASGVKGRQYLFNCHVSGWEADDITRHFEFTFLRLMEGGGVGANYSNKYLAGYEVVNNELDVHIVCSPEHPDYEDMRASGLLSSEYDSEWDGAFAVEDSREGWADALTDLLRTYYRDDVKHAQRVYDVTRVREAGARLKTFGGRASGPAPLAKMLNDVSGVMNRRLGRKLDGLSAMEIDHYIAECVVSGGNRRSARMAIMHWQDEQINAFIECKGATGKHWTTNISVEVDDEFWSLVEKGDTRAINTLYRIAEGMIKNGEPGFWNSDMSNVGEPNRVIATNPCLTGDTVIATLGGPRTFADLAETEEDVQVYSWDPETKTPVVRWMRRPHRTQENAEILKVTFDSGLVVRCTPEHSFYTFRGKKVQARDLTAGRSIRAFSASRDSSGHERIHGWDSKRNASNHQYTHRMIWENANGPIPEGMVIAHLDGDASNNDLDNLALMTPYEHASYDYPKRLANGFYHGTHPANHKVVSVEPAGFADVYNGMVEGSHTYIVLDPEPVAGHMSGIVSANCGEIALEAWENCNLGHVNLAAFVNDGVIDFDGLELAHMLMTRFLMRATYGDVRDDEQAKVLARNRRIGVGHFGFASFVAKAGIKYSDAPKSHTVIHMLDYMGAIVADSAKDYAHDLRIPVPVKTRTVAPTGTIAKMPGVSEGIHPIFAKYFIRRIRFSTVDPAQRDQCIEMMNQGYTVEDDIYADNTMVVSIPTKDTLMQEVIDLYGEESAEKIVQSAGDLTLEEMLEVQAMYQRQWADNAVSFTANVDPDAYTVTDVVDVLRAVGYRLKGATIFPEASMPLAPYERLTKEQFEAYTTTSLADSVDEECASGSCPVK